MEMETWRNKAHLTDPLQKTIRRSKYLNSHPEIKLNQNFVKHQLDIMKNGNTIKPLA